MAANPKQAPKSTMEQIIEKLIENLDGKPEFDKETLARFTEMAQNGELKTPSKVERFIKSLGGKQNENR